PSSLLPALNSQASRPGPTQGWPYIAVGMQSAWHSAMGFRSRPVKAARILGLVMPPEVSRYFILAPVWAWLEAGRTIRPTGPTQRRPAWSLRPRSALVLRASGGLGLSGASSSHLPTRKYLPAIDAVGWRGSAWRFSVALPCRGPGTCRRSVGGNMKTRRLLPVLLAALVAFGLVAGASAQEPRYGGTIPVAVTDDPPNLDPHITNAASARNILHNIFATIVEMNEEFVPAPGLAESWEISDDGLTYTFHLVENARFHDGTPVDAEAIVYNFDRIKDPATGSPRASELSFVESYEAADEYTFVARLSQ